MVQRQGSNALLGIVFGHRIRGHHHGGSQPQTHRLAGLLSARRACFGRAVRKLLFDEITALTTACSLCSLVREIHTPANASCMAPTGSETLSPSRG